MTNPLPDKPPQQGNPESKILAILDQVENTADPSIKIDLSQLTVAELTELLSLAKQRQEAHNQAADALKPKGISGVVQKGLRRVTGNRFGVTDAFNNRIKEMTIYRALFFLGINITLELAGRAEQDCNRLLENLRRDGEDLARLKALNDENRSQLREVTVNLREIAVSVGGENDSRVAELDQLAIKLGTQEIS